MNQFLKPKPIEPLRDWRTYSLMVPILSSTIGACIFTTLAFSFTELASLPQSFRTALVIIGAFTVGIGSTFGSAASGIEIYRKVYAKTAIVWDWIALSVSTLTTVGGFALGFAALLGAASVTGWARLVQMWGPLVLGALVSLDGLGDIVELGGLFGSYEVRLLRWEDERHQWDASHADAPKLPITKAQSITEPDELTPGQIKAAVLAAYTSTNPPTSYADFGETIGKAPSTVGYYVRQLRDEGKLNGRHN
jgi:hypothetical protein